MSDGVETWLREIASQVPGVFYRVHVAPDGSDRYTYVSEGVRALYGVEPQAVLADGTLLRHLDHPDDRDRVATEVAAARAAGRPLQIEFRIVPADGVQKWVQMVSTGVPGEGPGHLRVGVMTDVTARRHAERALLAHEERWRLALDLLGDGRWEWDIAAGREQVSPRLLQMYGLDPADHDGSTDALDALTHPDDRARMLEDRRRHLAGETPMYVNEHRMRGHDGRWIWVLSRGIVIERDADGRPLRMVGTHMDISERKEAESLRVERDRTAAAQRAQHEFLSRVSHELRTPLHAVIGFAQLLQMDGSAGERQRQWVDTIVTSGQHLLALVNDLLDLSGVQSGLLSVALADVDLAAMAREAWAPLLPLAGHLVFVDHLPHSRRVWADPVRLRQVLDNLLSNAVKYNRDDGRVIVGAEVQGEWIVFSVRDDGPGMDEAQLARLFSPFDRLGAQRSKVAGTGLGLALSRQLVQAMGGEIEVDSAPGRGSTFRVRLRPART